jgi:hypothetical protein
MEKIGKQNGNRRYAKGDPVHACSKEPIPKSSTRTKRAATSREKSSNLPATRTPQDQENTQRVKRGAQHNAKINFFITIQTSLRLKHRGHYSFF